MHAALEPPSQRRKQNERTCGRWSASAQAPPRILSKENQQHRSAPTIPSRYEVILFKGDREFLGFGSKSLKQPKQLPEWAPGPGEYGQPKTFHEKCGEKTSWGVRGTGGFASRSSRFGARSLPTLPQPGRGVPGPGTYNQDVALRVREPKDFNQAKRTAVFASQVLEKMPSDGGPGPGQYEAMTKSSLVKEACMAQAAFRSASLRTIGVPNASEDFPGPGEYRAEGGSPWAQQTEISGDACTANFKELSHPRIARVHRDLPAATRTTRDALGDLGDQVGRECLGTVGLANRLPGPGHYEQDRDAIWEAGVVGMNGSSSFIEGTCRHDWTSGDVTLVPGPGRYDPRRMAPDRLTSATSAFVSGAERNKTPHSHAPGPAYYAPSSASNKRSFWLNATKQWAT